MKDKDKKDKVINLLLERIATLEYEVERLNNIIDEFKLEQLKNKKIYGSSKYEVVYFDEALGSDKE